MPYRKIPHETKVKALKEHVTTNDVNKIAEKYGINRATLNIYYQRLITYIPEVVKNKKSGPKTKPQLRVIKSIDPKVSNNNTGEDTKKTRNLPPLW